MPETGKRWYMRNIYRRGFAAALMPSLLCGLLVSQHTISGSGRAAKSHGQAIAAPAFTMGTGAGQTSRIGKPKDSDTLLQVATLEELRQGSYDGVVPYSTVQRHGDFGLGTVDKLDGEMVAVDGQFFQVGADGVARRIHGSTTTPFAAVTFFDADRVASVPPGLSLDALCVEIEKLLADKNVFYAIRVDGLFQTVRTRSVPAQTKPYPTLAEVVKTQPTFDFENTPGVLAGFYSPVLCGNLNQAGYHFHFLTGDRKGGGHVLSLLTGRATIRIDKTPHWKLLLRAADDSSHAVQTPGTVK